MKKNKNKFYSFLWWIAIIIEWINIVLFMAAMGYEYNIPIYSQIRKSNNISTVYYIFAGIDIILFGILMMINRKRKDVKNTILALYCGLIQIALLMYKVKL